MNNEVGLCLYYGDVFGGCFFGMEEVVGFVDVVVVFVVVFVEIVVD